jgi:hypothetical protein
MHRGARCTRMLTTAFVAAAVMPGTAAAQTLTESYVGGPGYTTYVTACTDDQNIGVVCFDRPPSDFVAVAIADESGLPVSGYVIFLDASGEWTYGGAFCERTENVIPSDAKTIHVYLGGPVETGLHCTGWGRPGVAATRGEVQATFQARPNPAPPPQAATAPTGERASTPSGEPSRCTRARRVTVRVPRRGPVRVNGRRMNPRRGRLTVDLRRYRGRVVEVKAGRQVVKRWRVCD